MSAGSIVVSLLLALNAYWLYRILYQLRATTRTLMTLYNAYADKAGLPRAHPLDTPGTRRP